MTPGLHPGIAADVYHADKMVDAPTLSCGIAKILLRDSPRKAWHCHPRLNPNHHESSAEKFDLGRSAHAVLLENDASKIAVFDPKDYPGKKGGIPDGWTNDAIREARDKARAEGKTPLLKHNYDEVREMVDAALAFIEDSAIADEWHAGQSEVTGLWCEGNGKTPVWMRCRFDRISLPHRTILDYKTTDASVSPEPFSRFLVRMDYHIQEAFYRRGARAQGIDDPRFVFLAQSCEPPYECSLHACDTALQEIADLEVERAIKAWRFHLTTKSWPSYGGRIHFAIPSNFLMNEHEMRLAEAA